MNKLKAIQAMFKGKRVQQIGWPDNKYLCMTQGEKFINQTGTFIDINDYNGEWRECEEQSVSSLAISDKQRGVILAMCTIRELHRTTLSKMLGRSGQYMLNVLAQKVRVTEETMRNIAKALNIDEDKFLNTNVELKELL